MRWVYAFFTCVSCAHAFSLVSQGRMKGLAFALSPSGYWCAMLRRISLCVGHVPNYCMGCNYTRRIEVIRGNVAKYTLAQTMIRCVAAAEYLTATCSHSGAVFQREGPSQVSRLLPRPFRHAAGEREALPVCEVLPVLHGDHPCWYPCLHAHRCATRASLPPLALPRCYTTQGPQAGRV